MRTIFILLVFMLSACADTFSREKVEQTLIKGVTTKHEVLAVFGKPNGKYTIPGVKMSSGGKGFLLQKPCDVWLYSPHERLLKDLIEEEILRIIFNNEGIVTNYEYRDDGD
jgi:hypothetical protein